MTLNEFIKEYQGLEVPDNNGNFLGECVSLAARFALEVQEVPDNTLYCSKTGGARDLYEQFDYELPQYYVRIAPINPPQPGDLIIWDQNRGNYGHVAIAIDATHVFEQLGTPIFTPARVSVRPKTIPLGYLRLKEDSMSKEQMDAIQKQFSGLTALITEVRDDTNARIDEAFTALDTTNKRVDKIDKPGGVDDQAFADIDAINKKLDKKG